MCTQSNCSANTASYIWSESFTESCIIHCPMILSSLHLCSSRTDIVHCAPRASLSLPWYDITAGVGLVRVAELQFLRLSSGRAQARWSPCSQLTTGGAAPTLGSQCLGISQLHHRDQASSHLGTINPSDHVSCYITATVHVTQHSRS